MMMMMMMAVVSVQSHFMHPFSGQGFGFLPSYPAEAAAAAAARFYSSFPAYGFPLAYSGFPSPFAYYAYPTWTHPAKYQAVKFDSPVSQSRGWQDNLVVPELAVGGSTTSDLPVIEEALVTDSPVTDLPVTDVPATEDIPSTTVVDEPVTESYIPTTEIPTTEIPSGEMPSTETLAGEMPSTEVPVVETQAEPVQVVSSVEPENAPVVVVPPAVPTISATFFQLPVPVEDTPEVAAAKREFFRLFAIAKAAASASASTVSFSPENSLHSQ